MMPAMMPMMAPTMIGPMGPMTVMPMTAAADPKGKKTKKAKLTPYEKQMQRE